MQMSQPAGGKRPSSEARRGLLDVHLATVLFGLAGLFGKWIALSPVLIVLGRVFFASLSLGFLLLFFRQSFRSIPGKHRLQMIWLGAVLAVHWTAFFRSIQVSSVAVGLLSYSIFPVFTVFLETVFFKEKLDRTSLYCAGLCLLGVFLIVPRFDISNSVFQGVLWGLFSGLTFAVLAVFNRRLSQQHSSLAIAFVEDSSAALFLLPFFLTLGTRPSARDWLLLVTLGVACTAGAHTLFIKGMRHVRAQTASIISSLEPVYGIVLAFVFLRETPALRTLAGGALILSAVTLVTLHEKAGKGAS
jgi:drug/metabolite transporter (DMT)-like permease